MDAGVARGKTYDSHFPSRISETTVGATIIHEEQNFLIRCTTHVWQEVSVKRRTEASRVGPCICLRFIRKWARPQAKESLLLCVANNAERTFTHPVALKAKIAYNPCLTFILLAPLTLPDSNEKTYDFLGSIWNIKVFSSTFNKQSSVYYAIIFFSVVIFNSDEKR